MGISVVVPVFNEENDIVSTIERIHQTFQLKYKGEFEIIVVDDGSSDSTLEQIKEITPPIVLIQNKRNLGYGSSLKKGIKASQNDWIAIVDADGTYPIESFELFFEHLQSCDMVIGIRDGKVRKIPLIRRPAKWFLNKFSSYIAGVTISDVNSGMRLFKKKIAERYWNMYPEGFSFTTTITLSFILDDYDIKNVSIDYFKRGGKSKIRPFHDTYNFILLISRISMLFKPLKIFMPAFFFTIILTFLSVIRDLINLNLSDLTVILFLFSLLTLMLGLVADLINRRLSP